MKLKTTAIATMFLVTLAMPTSAEQRTLSLDGPEGFIPPPLHPAGIKLEAVPLGSDVYALLSNHPGVDNSGFIVGERGVLVIDAHINRDMAQQIQDAVKRVTPRPIIYLVNTNYHGDHTFGNYAFPDETIIVAHRETARHMTRFEEEREFLLPAVDDDATVFAEVELRLPDVEFDDHIRLDLGGRYVDLYHFGPGNTTGDTVVYEPQTQTAWTGNLVIGEGTIPLLIEGRPGAYLETISRFAASLELRTVIPGHGIPTTAAIFGRYVRYLTELMELVRKADRSGYPLATVLEEDLGPEYQLPPELAAAQPFISGLHKWNLQKAYLEILQRQDVTIGDKTRNRYQTTTSKERENE